MLKEKDIAKRERGMTWVGGRVNQKAKMVSICASRGNGIAGVQHLHCKCPVNLKWKQ